MLMISESCISHSQNSDFMADSYNTIIVSQETIASSEEPVERMDADVDDEEGRANIRHRKVAF